MFLPSFRSPSFRVLLIATVSAATIPHTAFGAPNSRAMREARVADYPLTKVGVVMFKTDYNRITQPGVILAVRLPGIYADVANTQDSIVNTNFSNGQVSQATGFWSARLEMCQWIRETLDKESVWDEVRSTNLSRW